ncbi:bromoperoxidase [Fibrisoma montanum]|uniref:Bromoperoxidase n=1 Tax=Fibrisoma montanum TaxID=2305895 RepID=A0A418MBK9_9BACT|nr:vanadium-dependent haloperoxidase [Fibrisoma montanum]RIV23755.1 bromoperoxidase [Fibrisoma montanum]
MKNRRLASHLLRYEAADVAYNRPHPYHRSNGEENRYRIVGGDGKSYPSYLAAFTKGMQHDDNGFLVKPESDAYPFFIRACDKGDLESIQALALNERVKPADATPAKPANDWRSKIALDADAKVRGWESMGAGLTYDLEGPDAQAVTIPPAPVLDSEELIAEMAELYWMALCRDIPFTDFDTNNSKINQAVADLNSLNWFKNKSFYGLQPYQALRKRGYFAQNEFEAYSPKTIFRGNVKGDDIGLYISQFLYVGNKSLGSSTVSFGADQGLISYGSTTIDQRVRTAKPKLDYMTTWEQWLDVQNGANLRELEQYENVDNDNNINRENGYRFIWTPRDLCTWVHYDALHQAYFNACLILLGINAPVDPGLPFRLPDSVDKQTGFAQFGGPHILNLVSEVATRALKAVRYQKYNVHRRARPEVVAGWIHRYASGHTNNLDIMKNPTTILQGLGLWPELQAYNQSQNQKADRKTDPSATSPSFLLPMPFVEGSPMHPSYGSGHATVAGACVTILKAFFDEGFELPFAYKPTQQGRKLEVDMANKGKLTVENELNKLAANVAFGRDWSGVHYWSDQIESLRLGEQIALGILEEQKLQYGENFSMNVPLFDGTSVRI